MFNRDKSTASPLETQEETQRRGEPGENGRQEWREIPICLPPSWMSAVTQIEGTGIATGYERRGGGVHQKEKGR